MSSTRSDPAGVTCFVETLAATAGGVIVLLVAVCSPLVASVASVGVCAAVLVASWVADRRARSAAETQQSDAVS